MIQSPVLPYVNNLQKIRENVDEPLSTSERDSTQKEIQTSQASTPNIEAEISTDLESGTLAESSLPGDPQSQSSPVFEPFEKNYARIETSNKPVEDIAKINREGDVDQNGEADVVLTCHDDIPHTECQVSYTPPSTNPPSPARSESAAPSGSPLIDMADDFKDDESFGAPTIDTDCLYSQAESDTPSAVPDSGHITPPSGLITPHSGLVTPDSGHVTAQDTEKETENPEVENIPQEDITTATDEGATDDNVEEVTKENKEQPTPDSDTHTETGEVVHLQDDNLPTSPIVHYYNTADGAADASDSQMDDDDAEVDLNKRAEMPAAPQDNPLARTLSVDNPLADVESAFDLQEEKKDTNSSEEDDDLILVSQTSKRKIDLEALMSGDRDSEDDFEPPTFVVNSPMRKKAKTESPLTDKFKRSKKGGKAKRSLDVSSQSQVSESGSEVPKKKSKKKKKKQKLYEDCSSQRSEKHRKEGDSAARKRQESESDEETSKMKHGWGRKPDKSGNRKLYRPESDSDNKEKTKRRSQRDRIFGTQKTRSLGSARSNINSDSELESDQQGICRRTKDKSCSKERRQKHLPPKDSDMEQDSQEEEEEFPKTRQEKKKGSMKDRKDKNREIKGKRKKKSVSSDSEDQKRVKKGKVKKKKKKKVSSVHDITFPESESEPEETGPTHEPKRRRTQSYSEDEYMQNLSVQPEQDSDAGSMSEQDVFHDSEQPSSSQFMGSSQIPASQASQCKYNLESQLF